MTPNITVSRLPLQDSDWLWDPVRQTVVISSCLTDEQAAVAEREAFRVLQSLPG